MVDRVCGNLEVSDACDDFHGPKEDRERGLNMLVSSLLKRYTCGWHRTSCPPFEWSRRPVPYVRATGLDVLRIASFPRPLLTLACSAELITLLFRPRADPLQGCVPLLSRRSLPHRSRAPRDEGWSSSSQPRRRGAPAAPEPEVRRRRMSRHCRTCKRSVWYSAWQSPSASESQETSHNESVSSRI